ncbi:phosphoribosyl pyrophosphokinase [Aulographum hederae CBS 113979]|uniref:Ribose-phosphate pyrophosphokinase 1 n=1 Tax=Aulographum hederae CBS 113979 TaxID=1176131 RepID=A0A6G1HH14_9PEZI|nr:phosphoribosyl pyrophosphokinase [Aulographum hederae CBS 113979]
MRQTQIFAGSSHPVLVDQICDRLGQRPGRAELRKFSNGETSVQIQTSIRDQDVFIVQSGSSKINDSVMELLIMISACKSGSAKSITAVVPYFPYSRQSKKKSHRGAITARMLANLLNVAGVDHVITIDLHASQMQGFFRCPVDNLVAEPLIARWIRHNVPDWQDAVVVSKNAGGTKRVTSLADALKLSFGIVTTDRRRFNQTNGDFSLLNSQILSKFGADGAHDDEFTPMEEELEAEAHISPPQMPYTYRRSDASTKPNMIAPILAPTSVPPQGPSRRPTNQVPPMRSPLAKATTVDSDSALDSRPDTPTSNPAAPPHPEQPERKDSEVASYTDERARDVIHGRLIHGHIVDEDHPSPSMSSVSGGGRRTGRTRAGTNTTNSSEVPEAMTSSFLSTVSRHTDTAGPGGAGLGGGTGDAGPESEDEEDDLKNPELETTVTLVGNVKDRTVFIVDDMIDKSGSWIAAAETVIKRGGAKKVYCMATHGLFGGDCLEEMDECECIEKVVVTDSFPILEEKRVDKLVVLGVAGLLSEAIRRNHYGESISQLYVHDT